MAIEYCSGNQNRFQKSETCRCQPLLISLPSTNGMCIETREGHRNAFPLRFCLGLSFCDSFPLRFVEFPAEPEDLAPDHWGTHRAGYDAVTYQVRSQSPVICNQYDSISVIQRASQTSCFELSLVFLQSLSIPSSLFGWPIWARPGR